MPRLFGKEVTSGEYDEYYKWNSKPNAKCVICGKEFYARPNRLKTLKHGGANGICCSKKCNNKYRSIWFREKGNHQYNLKGANNPTARCEKIISNYGYILVLPPKDYPKELYGSKGRIFEHRLVVEKHHRMFNEDKYFQKINGKYYLKPDVEVHHLNEIKTDNRIENLMPVFKSEHKQLHVLTTRLLKSNVGRLLGYSSVGVAVDGPIIEIDSKNSTYEVKFKRLSEKAVIPTKASDGNAGLDFYSTEKVEIPPHSSVIVKSNIAWQPNNINLYMQLQGRSGLCFKEGIELCNAGVIDANYTGNIAGKLYNTTEKPYTIMPGDRIFQGIIFDKPTIIVVESTTFEKTDRGDNGFGSSGK